MPRRSGLPLAGIPVFRFDPIILLLEAKSVDLLLQQEIGITHLFDLHPAHHLPDDDFDVFVIDIDPLQAVDFLNFVDQVCLQFLFSEHRQNVMRIQGTVHQRFASFHSFAFLNVHVNSSRQRVFFFHTTFIRDQDLAGSFGNIPVPDHTVNFCNDGRFARLPGFKQFHDARQSARNILGLGGFARDLGQNIARMRLHLRRQP